ncbi:MAG TPA: hypothetical protein VFZ11_15465 [Gemmatimonadaceae bacterium]
MHVPPPLRALLHGAIDYAGLFPPAALDMRGAAARYAAYRASDDRWALGRFVVPAARLGELERAIAGLGRGAAASSWPLSVLIGDDLSTDTARIAAHAATSAPMRIESLEARVASASDVRRFRDAFPEARELYLELPAGGDPRPLIEAIGAAGARAKIRTGGVTAAAVPEVATVVRFLAACIALGVPFKATAGLHHPLRAEYALTYEAGAPRATMHGYLNVFLGAALLANGAPEQEAERLLDERDPLAFEVTDDGILWRGSLLTTEAIDRLRARGATSFGSCSFREPLDDLAALPSLVRTT